MTARACHCARPTGCQPVDPSATVAGGRVCYPGLSRPSLETAPTARPSSLLPGVGAEPQLLPLPSGPKAGPRMSRSLCSWGSSWLSARPRCCPDLDPPSLAPTPWCLGQVLCGVLLSACPLGVPRFRDQRLQATASSPPCAPAASPPNLFLHMSHSPSSQAAGRPWVPCPTDQAPPLSLKTDSFVRFR